MRNVRIRKYGISDPLIWTKSLYQGWAIFSLPRTALAIHIFVEDRRKKINNVVDSKRNYFFKSESTAHIHLKTVNKLSWTYLLQQRGPHKKPLRAGYAPRAVVWAALVYMGRFPSEYFKINAWTPNWGWFKCIVKHSLPCCFRNVIMDVIFQYLHSASRLIFILQHPCYYLIIPAGTMSSLIFSRFVTIVESLY
jgi:hypothetical protein